MAEPPYPEALPTLTRLHWYVLERVLGQGGFGITYVAKDTNLDQRVAIKEYLPVEFATRLPDSTVRSRTDELRDRYRWGLERFIQEARTLARFDHPNIVRVLSVFEFNNTAYIVMRFEEGGTLASMLDRRGTLPEAELLRILVQVLDGLTLVHNAGFIHRDIKPDNIHIGGDGRPVLLDFGSARQAVGSSNTLTILIAPGYAPFEQYYNDPSSQGPWTDIYGLGATAYRAICGRAPLDAVSRSKGILGSTQEIMVPASVVGAGRYSGHFLAAIDHALAFAEKDRPQTIAEWRRELAGEGPSPVVAPAAPARGQSLGRTTASQPTVLVEAATAVPGAAMALAQGGASTSHSAAERVSPSRYAPPWAWVLVIIAVAVAAVAVFAALALREALKDQKDANNSERTSKQQPDNRQPKLPEPAPEQKQTPPAPSPSPPEENKQEDGKPQGEAPPRAKPKASPAPVPPKKEPAPVPTPTPKKESVPAPKKEPGSPAPSPPAPKESPQGGEPSIVPPSKEVPAPAEKAPAARTTPELLADAEKAWSEQRYAEAIKTWEPLANAGSPRAQARMGDALSEGKGVERDAAKAIAWYEKSANGGEMRAMMKLCAIFSGGNEPNNNLAYIWCGVAAEMGSSAGKAEREKIASSLQPAERQQADRVVKNKVDEIVKRGKEK